MNLQRTPLFDILAGSWALERNLGCLGRALMNDEYFRRCIFNIDHAQTTRCRPGCLFSASSSFARYLSLYSKKFKLGLLFSFVVNLSIPHEHRKAWLKTFFAFRIKFFIEACVFPLSQTNVIRVSSYIARSYFLRLLEF